jgi:Pyridoxamine 5'-phosphate oxidase
MHGSDRPADAGEYTQLDRAESLCLLGSVPVGRLIFTINALPAVRPMNFAFSGTLILLRTAADSTMARQTDGAIVAFEADELDATAGSGWSVVVTATIAGAPAMSDHGRSFVIRIAASNGVGHTAVQRFTFTDCCDRFGGVCAWQESVVWQRSLTMSVPPARWIRPVRRGATVPGSGRDDTFVAGDGVAAPACLLRSRSTAASMRTAGPPARRHRVFAPGCRGRT